MASASSAPSSRRAVRRRSSTGPQHAGVALPHYAASQYGQSEKVPYSQIRPGDLIFYATDTSRPSSIHHVTMYVGGGRMIEAPFTGADVRIVAVRWNRTMPWAGRP